MRLFEFVQSGGPNGPNGNGPKLPGRRFPGDDEEDMGSTFAIRLAYMQDELARRTNDQSYNYLSFDEAKYKRAEDFYDRHKRGEYLFIPGQKLPVYVEVDDIIHSLIYATRNKQWDPSQHLNKFDAEWDDEETFNDGIGANTLAVAYLNGTAKVGQPPDWRKHLK